MQRRPREVPVDKPSTAQIYVPKALLRDDDREPPGSATRRRWLPTGSSRPDASKHLLTNQAKHMALHTQKVEAIAYSSEAQVTQLHVLEDEVEVLEIEIDKFVQEFYVAAATFSAQASTQKALVRALIDG